MTALSSRNLPKNPASGGMPASETIASVMRRRQQRRAPVQAGQAR